MEDEMEMAWLAKLSEVLSLVEEDAREEDDDVDRR